MKVQSYNRSDVLSFYDLTPEQRAEAFRYDDSEEAREQSYVLFDFTHTGEKQPLSLGHFMRSADGCRYHGVFGLSYFSAYGIILSRCGTQAIVAYLTW